MDIIDLHTFKQLVGMKDEMSGIVIEHKHYQNRLQNIYKELDKLIMDIVMSELESK